MGAVDRSRRRIQLSSRAVLRISLCFVMGFLTGFAPSSSYNGVIYRPIHSLPAPIAAALMKTPSGNRSLVSSMPFRAVEKKLVDPVMVDVEGSGGDVPEESPRRQLIVVTTTRAGDGWKMAQLIRLSHTLAMVPPPLLWVVVEPLAEASETAKMLRRTGIIYRHLTFGENFTDADAEAHHQQNVALNHVEHHRLTGVVHFSSVSNFYDLQFFEEIRGIEMFGAWPVAIVAANTKPVLIEGPVCSSSKVLGWFSKDLADGTTQALKYRTSADRSESRPISSSLQHTINLSGFAFNSSVLWDPERWGRPTSLPDTSQDSINFIRDAVLEDSGKLKGIPSDCSRIMIWQAQVQQAGHGRS